MRLHAGAELTLSSFDYDVSAQATVPVTIEGEGSVLVAARALAETARSLTCGAEVSIALALPGEGGPDGGLTAGGDGMIGFEGGGRRTTTRLLGGEFPRYQALLPNHVNSTAELSTALLAEAVKRVALVAERNTAVRLAFTPGQLVLEAGTGEEAQAVEVLEAGSRRGRAPSRALA